MTKFDCFVSQIKAKQYNDILQAVTASFLIIIILVVLNSRANNSLMYYQQQQSALEQQINEMAGNGEAARAAVSNEKSKIVKERQLTLQFVNSITSFHEKPVCLSKLEKKSRHISIEGKARSVNHLTDILGNWQKHFPSFNVKLVYLKKLNTGFVGFQVKIKDANDYFSTMLDGKQKQISIL